MVKLNVNLIKDWKNYSFDTLIEFVKLYDNRAKSIKKIIKAYKLAEKQHNGVTRDDNKTPYIMHPVAVANFLAIMRVDVDSICAGLLHDTIEDTNLTKEDIEKEFGIDVANIVEGVTKITKLEYADYINVSMNKSEAEAKRNLKTLNQKKIIESLLYDPRIAIVKLADRLHNMLTIENKPLLKQKSKAKETLELYVPLANIFGIYKIQQELENASLKCIDKDLYERIKKSREEIKEETLPLVKDAFNKMVNVIKDNIKEIGRFSEEEMLDKSEEELLEEVLYIGPNLSRTRIKHIYGVYDALLKMKETSDEEKVYFHKLNFDSDTYDKIHDLRVAKLIVKDEDACFQVLRYLHKAYYGKYINKYEKDYIYNPKQNMYKSLHSTVIHDGCFVQFQIRTIEQEYRDTYGLAWELYKYDGENTRERILEEFKKYPAYQRLLDVTKDTNSLDLSDYRSLLNREILNRDNITIIDKSNGKSVTVPLGTTIHDLAYVIYGDLGNHLVSAKINDEMYIWKDQQYPFGRKLEDGDIISLTFNENILCYRPGTKVLVKKEKMK